MKIRLSASAARRCRARIHVTALLATVSLLCLLLATLGIVHYRATSVTTAWTPAPGSPQIVCASTKLQADLRTAFHVACYLLDPRV